MHHFKNECDKSQVQPDVGEEFTLNTAAYPFNTRAVQSIIFKSVKIIFQMDKSS